jgi:adenosine kinase
MAVLLGMGNPLLDISADVDAAFLEKYGLKPADAILADEGGKHKPLFEEMVANPTVQYSGGGATQNSIRVCQWMLPDSPGSTAFMGSVGKDKNAEQMTECGKKDGVNVLYHVDEAHPTGTCAACIVNNDRSMVAALQAADHYKVEHLKANWSVVEGAKIFYSAGFFVTHPGGAASIAEVSKHANETGKTYCFNLGAPFILQVPPFREVVDKTMPFIDILFGNETEAGVYAETAGWDEKDIPSIAKKLSLLPKEGKPRTVVITQCCDPACVAINGEVTEYPVLKLEKSQLKDTTGAGDSYVAGFLAGLVLGKDIKDCARAGAYAASEIVQQSGCQFPKKPDFKW